MYNSKFALKENLYAEGMPVIIKTGELFIDETGKPSLRLEFQNVSGKTIEFIKAEISLYDVAGRMLGSKSQYYMDLNFLNHCECGADKIIRTDNLLARSFEVSIEEVVFDDKSIWNNVDKKTMESIDYDLLSDELGDKNLLKQYKREASTKSKFIPKKHKDLWICTCGKINRSEDECCYRCHANYERLVSLLNDKESLRKNYEQKRKSNMKKIKKFSLICLIVLINLFLVYQIITPIAYYNKANTYLNQGDITKAALSFGKARYFKNADKQSMKLWRDAIPDKTLSAGAYHTVQLKEDGTVIAKGANYNGQCDVSEWEDIVDVSAGYNFTVGLKSDGTVIATGVNNAGQLDVSEWNNIIDVEAGTEHTVGLKKDGTVVVTGDNLHGEADVSKWKNIVAISAGEFQTVGLKKDGTVIHTGEKVYDVDKVSDWKDIVAVSVGNCYVLGLKEDGTVISSGAWVNSVISSWKNVVSVDANYNHIIGIQKDGKIIGVGLENYKDEFFVSYWKDIVEFSVGYDHVIGLTKNGVTVATGDNRYDQCDVADFITTPQTSTPKLSSVQSSASTCLYNNLEKIVKRFEEKSNQTLSFDVWSNRPYDFMDIGKEITSERKYDNVRLYAENEAGAKYYVYIYYSFNNGQNQCVSVDVYFDRFSGIYSSKISNDDIEDIERYIDKYLKQ